MCELIYIQRIDEGRTAGLKLTMGHHPYEAESTMRAPLFANLGSRYAELGKGA